MTLMVKNYETCDRFRCMVYYIIVFQLPSVKQMCAILYIRLFGLRKSLIMAWTDFSVGVMRQTASSCGSGSRRLLMSSTTVKQVPTLAVNLYHHQLSTCTNISCQFVPSLAVNMHKHQLSTICTNISCQHAPTLAVNNLYHHQLSISTSNSRQFVP